VDPADAEGARVVLEGGVVAGEAAGPLESGRAGYQVYAVTVSNR